jgi:hypothetical protein
MATKPRPLISESLMHQIEETAQEQNREPAEVLEEAWVRYIKEHSWAKLSHYGAGKRETAGPEGIGYRAPDC